MSQNNNNRTSSSALLCSRSTLVALLLYILVAISQIQISLVSEVRVIQSIIVGRTGSNQTLVVSSSSSSPSPTVAPVIRLQAPPPPSNATLFPVRRLADTMSMMRHHAPNNNNETTNQNGTRFLRFYVADTKNTKEDDMDSRIRKSMIRKEDPNPNVSQHSNQTTTPTPTTKPIMAILTSTRSKRDWTSAADSPLQHLIRSISLSVTAAEVQQWDIRLLVAMDDDDGFWLENQTVTNETDYRNKPEPGVLLYMDQFAGDGGGGGEYGKEEEEESQLPPPPLLDSPDDLQDDPRDHDHRDDKEDKLLYDRSSNDVFPNDDYRIRVDYPHDQLAQLQVPAWLTLIVGVYPRIPNHIPFNEIALAAYEMNAEYYCRVNDDSSFNTTAWMTRAVHVLQEEFDPPNVGVVGPSCLEGNTGILTHDMTHKTHMEIFHQQYYPPQFHNWYLDDWITIVYREKVLGVDRSRKLTPEEWRVHHWVTSPRYSPDMKDFDLLPAALAQGRNQILDYLRQHHAHHNTTAVVGAKAAAAEKEAAAAAAAKKAAAYAESSYWRRIVVQWPVLGTLLQSDYSFGGWLHWNISKTGE